MGEHGTWFDFLNRFSWWQELSAKAEHLLGRGEGSVVAWSGGPFAGTHFSLTHVLVTLLVLGFVTYGAARWKSGLKAKDGGLVPPRKMNLRNFFEVMTESVYGMVEGAMGPGNARRFFPLIGTLWCFILFSNLIGLIPGFIAPTDTLKTNVALAPLMLPIEIISHLARPLSLSFRLMGNMVADHKVVIAFFTLVPILVPVPFLLLGVLVCLVQALVFCMLTMVYIGSAIEHEEH
jgi:F-type H+-transporting ATPase subunit a